MSVKKAIIPVFLNQRGCPFACVYCHQATLWGEVSVTYSLKQVEAYLKNALNTVNQNSDIEVAFYGGTFTGLPVILQEEYLSLVHRFKQAGKIQAVRLSTRPDLLGDNIITLLKTYAVDLVEIGTQSLDDEVLELSSRGYKAQTVKQAVNDLKLAGIGVGIQLMCGLPGDTLEKFMFSLEETIHLKPDCGRLYPTLVLAGTKLAEWYKAGKYQPLDLETAVEWGVIAKEKFDQAGIKLIRLGLHLSLNEELAKKIIAGPVHSAFGQLVKSRRLRKKIEEILAELPQTSGSAEFFVPKRSISDFLGVNQREYLYLKTRFPQLDLSWSLNKLSDTILISSASKNYQLKVA